MISGNTVLGIKTEKKKIKLSSRHKEKHNLYAEKNLKGLKKVRCKYWEIILIFIRILNSQDIIFWEVQLSKTKQYIFVRDDWTIHNYVQ